MSTTLSKMNFAFWVYLMTDCVLFATLFAAYAVLRTNSFGGVTPHDVFNLPLVMKETLLLLTSSFTCGLAMLAVHAQKRTQAVGWLSATFLLGLSFLVLEISEFQSLIHAGHGPQASGFLSSYFTLVGTHGLHIFAGLIAILLSLGLVARKGLNSSTTETLTNLSLFWHFLDIVWIFIFTLVYLFGV